MQAGIIFLLIAMFYFLFTALLALAAALWAGRRSRKESARAFRAVFGEFFLNFLNPLNWF